MSTLSQVFKDYLNEMIANPHVQCTHNDADKAHELFDGFINSLRTKLQTQEEGILFDPAYILLMSLLKEDYSDIFPVNDIMDFAAKQSPLNLFRKLQEVSNINGGISNIPMERLNTVIFMTPTTEQEASDTIHRLGMTVLSRSEVPSKEHPTYKSH